MYGNGAATGMVNIPVQYRRTHITTVVPSGWHVVGAGGMARGAYVWRFVAMKRPLPQAETWGFVFAGLRPDYALAFFRFYPLKSLKAPGHGITRIRRDILVNFLFHPTNIANNL